ncbi:hypothetical protein AEAC466_03410 [Asticcacaulis sp. AC466]|nr:hypothetical protein AEAC466_03410 [Asticcacaulis sp. AC466]
MKTKKILIAQGFDYCVSRNSQENHIADRCAHKKLNGMS